MRRHATDLVDCQKCGMTHAAYIQGCCVTSKSDATGNGWEVGAVTDAEIRGTILRTAEVAGQRGIEALDAGLTELRAVGGRAADLAGTFAADLARAQVEVAAGRLSEETGRIVLDRTLRALEEIQLGLGEGAAREGIRRGRQLLAVARDAAILLAGVAARAALAGL